MRAILAGLFCAATLVAAAQKKVTPPPKPPERPGESWPIWGGPRHNFISTSTGLADTWPKEGPTRVWSRPLGDGYSPIAEENGVLFTGYRRGSKDVVIALSAATGSTVWEYEYDAPFRNNYSEAVGPGPYAMPQVIGDRVVTASGVGKIHSLDKKTGKPVWSHDLYTEFAANQLPFGYSCHGLPYKDTLIYLAGGDAPWFGFGQGSAVIAFRQSDGAVVWKNQGFKNAHSSPLPINVDGQPQVVALLADQVIGFSPDNGELLWKYPHPTQHGLAVATPVMAAGNLIFISSAYSGGARVLQLARSGSGTTVKELWHNPRVQLHFGTAILMGDYIYLSSGHSGPAFITAVELRTGRIAWQARDFAKAQLLYADGKLIILDEDGNLGLASATPERFQVLSRVSLLKRISWTPPTLVGSRLYVRDRANMMALELGALPPDKPRAK
jgi:outer membrane protein assembly factor BamB